MRKILGMLILVGLTLSGCGAFASEQMTAAFFDAGKADAILLTTQGCAVLIDTGLNDNAEELVSKIRAAGVKTLDAMIITHFDKDHVGGAARVLEEIPVAQVLEPDYEKSSKQMTRYREALETAEIIPQALSQNSVLELGGMTLNIDVADEAYEQENDLSLVIRLQYGKTRFLLAGDAENDRLAELLDAGDLACDVLKVPHHGVLEKLSPAFFEACGAKYAVIFSSAEDPEQQETVLALQAAGTDICLTREGDVTIFSDGTGVSVGK